jgi:glutamate-1-semialdehyde aminotransferase
VAAALVTISYVERDDCVFFKNMAAVQARLVAGLREIAARRGHRMLTQDCPGVIMFYPVDLDRAWNIGEWLSIADHAKGERIRQYLFDHGVLILFRGRWFFSGAHTNEDCDRTLGIVDDCLKEL